MDRKKLKAAKQKLAVELPVDSIKPNNWNHNVMDADKFDRLKKWVEISYTEMGRLADPLKVRSVDGRYEIIDGEHRWRAVKELGYKKVVGYVYNCSKKRAMQLTDTLNYLRGDPDESKAGEYFKGLIELGETPDSIAEHTHYTADEVEDIMLTAGIEVDRSLPFSDNEGEKTEPKQTDAWIEMKFSVPVGAAEVIEAELSRIGGVLEGKSIRNRALEYMAVLSSQTSLDDIIGAEAKKALKPIKKLKRKKKKS